MKLYVMRHGPAEESAASGLDGDRALTAGGRQRVQNVAKALLESREEPVSVFTSPLVRAVQTAEIVAIVTGLGHRDGTVTARHDIAPGGNGVQLVRRLASEGSRRVMVVGHEPDLSDLVSTLLGTPFEAHFEKAMVVGLHIPSQNAPGRLRFILEPKTLHLAFSPGA